MVNERKRLVGYISLDALDEWDDDYSYWSGEITFPDPQGANLAWLKTIEMVERRPNERIISREEVLGAFARAFCTPENSHKEMDVKLGEAMLNELFGATDEGEGK